MIEKEIKFMVSPEQFSRFRDIISKENQSFSEIWQVNYLLDTSDKQLFSNDISSRIRYIDDENCEFTIKAKIEDEISNIHIKNEETYRLNINKAKGIIENKVKPFEVDEILKYYINHLPKCIKIEEIQLIGSIITIRQNFTNIIDQCIVSLDENYYLGKVDYEIELEFIDDLQADEFRAYLEHSKISVGEFTLSKTNRFMNALDTLEK